MNNKRRFLIVDGYPRQSRDDQEQVGMQFAWKLYGNMLTGNLPGAEYDVLLPSDFGVEIPGKDELLKYSGILWTGCNLSINDTGNPSVKGQIELAKMAYEIGIPSFGSCWGLQISVVAAGGTVVPNPKGKEMGIARKISMTEDGIDHPMFDGKSRVFEAFISHDDMVLDLPPGATLLAGNDFTRVQALSVTHEKGTFWSVQYHPEYNLNEMASLILARVDLLVKLGFYKNHKAMERMVAQMKTLHANPDRKDLRWQLAVDDDILDTRVRELEFSNWIKYQILA